MKASAQQVHAARERVIEAACAWRRTAPHQVSDPSHPWRGLIDAVDALEALKFEKPFAGET